MSKLKRKELPSFLIFVLPSVLLVILFYLIPFFSNLYFALTKWDGVKPPVFIGFENFKAMFTTDRRLGDSARYTVKNVIASVILTNVCGLGLALLLNTKIKAKKAFRAIFFMPYGLSGLIVAFMFSFIFTIGFKNLFEITSWKFLEWGWLSEPQLAWVSVLIVGLWQGVGYYMIVYTAGLQGVPPELVESAKVDGANSVQIFFRVTLPMLMPTITICLFLSLSGALNSFDGAYGLTKGGPGYATTGMPMNIYKEAFTNMEFGYASAKSLVYFVVVLVISLLQLRLTQSREVEV